MTCRLDEQSQAAGSFRGPRSPRSPSDMEVGTAVWVPDEHDVWRAGEVVAREVGGSDGVDDGSSPKGEPDAVSAAAGDITLTVRPLDGGSEVIVHLTASALAAEAGGGAPGGSAGAARSRVGKRDSSSAPVASRVLQRNLFTSEDGFVGVDDLILLPHLHEVGRHHRPRCIDVHRSAAARFHWRRHAI